MSLKAHGIDSSPKLISLTPLSNGGLLAAFVFTLCYAARTKIAL
jgi:hypothetical protein